MWTSPGEVTASANVSFLTGQHIGYPVISGLIKWFCSPASGFPVMKGFLFWQESPAEAEAGHSLPLLRESELSSNCVFRLPPSSSRGGVRCTGEASAVRLHEEKIQDRSTRSLSEHRISLSTEKHYKNIAIGNAHLY